MHRAWMKRFLMLTVSMCMLLISACGGQQAWEDEQLDESDVGPRILADHVKADWKLVPSPTEDTGHLIQVTFRLQDGSPVEAFELTHEKLLHLIMVSKDLSYFNHVHPEYKGGGVFEIANDFPAGGEYRMIADFKPAGGDAMTKLAWLEVEGEPALPAPVVLTDPLEATTDGKRVTLRISSLAPDEESVLAFHVEEEVSGRPITDLEPYLGAIGHVVILSEDGERYVHVHAEEDQGSGPDASFEATFPKNGVYKIWAQFQHKGRVFTASYAVQVR
jgi:hypothetical protein